MLCASLMIIIVDETVLNVAIPALFRQLNASSSEVQWAVDAYVLVYAALLFPSGNLGDRFGRRTFLVAGLVVFGGASLVAAWAPDAGVLIGARAVMAVGGAMIMPQTLSILVEVFSERERAAAIGVWSAISGIGILAGPIVGGWLVEHFWWGSVFLVNLPIVIVAIAASLVLLPNHRDPVASPADPTGTVLAILALSGVLFAIIELPGRGLASPMILLTGLGGIAAAVAFVVVELRSPNPMFDVRVLAKPVIAVSSVVIVAAFFTLQGTAYALTQYLQLVQGRGALATGLTWAPTTIGWSVAAWGSAAVVRRVGHRGVLGASMAALAASCVPLALLTPSTALLGMLVVFGLQGVALGLAITPVTDLIMGALPQARAGVASALNDATRQVGGAVGVAVLGSVLSAGFDHELGRARLPVRVENLADGIDSGLAQVVDASRAAFMTGMSWVMWLSVAVVAAATLVAVLVRWRPTDR